MTDTTQQGAAGLCLADLARCFEGAIPVVLATASAAGVPNVTYLSKAHVVDDERIALSNQFLSKSARNLAENPRALAAAHRAVHPRRVPPRHRLRAHRAARAACSTT